MVFRLREIIFFGGYSLPISGLRVWNLLFHITSMEGKAGIENTVKLTLGVLWVQRRKSIVEHLEKPGQM
jgi:hypothetical protein